MVPAGASDGKPVLATSPRVPAIRTAPITPAATFLLYSDISILSKAFDIVLCFRTASSIRLSPRIRNIIRQRGVTSEDVEDYVLKGTTLRVYRCLYRAGVPLGVHDIQRALELSSPSVAEYHIKKLVRAGLVQEKEGGYVVDRVLFENLIRIRRTVVPLQTTYVAFFISTLLVLVLFLRPAAVTSLYFFALAVNLGGVVITVYEALKTFAVTA